MPTVVVTEKSSEENTHPWRMPELDASFPTFSSLHPVFFFLGGGGMEVCDPKVEVEHCVQAAGVNFKQWECQDKNWD